MDVSRYASLFLAESREHLLTCNRLLLELERDPASVEPVGGIFRAMHTIKGMAATMGYGPVTDLAHRAENLLALLRERITPASPEVLELLFRSVDALEQGIDIAVRGEDAGAHLGSLLSDLDAAAARMGTAEFPIAMPGAASASRAEPAAGRLVRVRVRRDAIMRGGRATIALRKAEGLGRLDGVRPAVAAFERDDFDGAFSFRFDGSADDAALEAAIRSAGDIDEVAIGEAPVHAEVAPGETGSGARRHIRVDLGRLDTLMNVMGELVVARGRLTDVVTGSASPELEAVSARITRLVNTLQSEVIAVRLTPVWQVFDRYPRIIRDLARQLGKRVEFQIEGGDIELDRAILDEIGDPLLHLLRNAVDHGIEPARERERLGKPAAGRIVLSAARDRQGVAIRVIDDGRGIDREGVLTRARKEGLVEPDARTLPDDQLLRILSRAGFSTAEQVTDVSGRGVGVDAVLSRVRQLGGRVSLRTDPGRGTTVTMQLPVTLAVLKVLLAGVGEERYAVPLTHVAETVQFDPERVTSLGGREALVLRDDVIPTRHLRDVLEISAPAMAVTGRRPTIILVAGERRAALVVDQLLGQHEIVVEAFDAPRGMLPVFSGATILGDGHPALILDAAALT